MKQLPEKSDHLIHHRPETLEFHRCAIGKTIQLMRQDAGTMLDWTTLAEIACMSRYHFLRIFEELTGASPHRFLIALRMESAKKMLLESTIEIGDICRAVGYTSVGTFSRVFKELVGVAPGGFRQLAVKLSEPGLQLLLAEHLNQRICFYSRTVLRAELYLPDSFVGNVFIGVFDSQFQPLMPPAVSVVRQSSAVGIPVVSNAKEVRLLAVGFPDPVSANQYFLPNNQLPMAVSPVIQSSSGDPSNIWNIPLKLNTPRIFDLPVLTCLPLLLLKSVETKHVD